MGAVSLRTRRPAAPRLIATLGFFALSATFFTAILVYLLIHRADENRDLGRRTALISAIADIRAAGTPIEDLDPQFLSGLERTLGLKGLRLETEAVETAREMQPAIDADGRIVGWFTWERDASAAGILGKLLPFLAASAGGLIGFAALAVWQLRRSMQALVLSEERALQLAHEDPLTRLPNRRHVLELIDEALAKLMLGDVLSLAIVDIDALNQVNDLLGRQAGDRLLAAFAERLRQVNGCTAGRIADDEFALFIGSTGRAQARDSFATIAEMLARPYWTGEQSLQVGVTMGIAHASREMARDEFLRCADLALREAKRTNRGGLLEFTPEMVLEFVERQFIERELGSALAEGALDVHYQPIVTADGSSITGVEALARWNHPDRGAISPEVFVPVAEQAGLMGKLGEFVMRRALDDAQRWPTLSIAINISPLQVRDPYLAEFVGHLLAASGVAPSRVWLEVTESVLIDNPEEAKRRLDALQGIGVRLALDDFGTGYSSLSYLQRLRFDMLKIDRAFVEPLGKARGAEAIIQAIVALGRALNLRIAGEGVETEQQRVILRLAGCEEMQGFLFARPSPREFIDRLVVEAATAAGPRAMLRTSARA